MWFKHTIATHIETPNPKIEEYILKYPKSSYEYSKNVLKKRWKKYEDVLMGATVYDLEAIKYLCLYSKNVVKGRWKKAEEKIKKSLYRNPGRVDSVAKFLCLYAKSVIKGRWKEIEDHILNSNQIGYYMSCMKNKKDIDQFNRIIKLKALNGNQNCINFSTWNPTHKIKVEKESKKDVMVMKLVGNNSSKSPWSVTNYGYWGSGGYKTIDQKDVCVVFKLDEWLKSGHRCDEVKYTHYMFDEKNNKIYRGKPSRRREVKASLSKIEEVK